VKIAILGFGVEGSLALDYWNSADNQITICDDSESIIIPSGINSKLGKDYLKDLDQFDLIIRSPGLSSDKIINANNSGILSKLTTTTNEFFKVSPTKKIIGVTGTKGKGTTSTLIYDLLKASGKRAYFGGNVGNGAMDLLSNNIQPDDWVVLELSSYQLSDIKYSPHIAVCLMIAPEHLNWHVTMESYLEAKQNIFSYQSNDDIAIYYSKNDYSADLAFKSRAIKVPYFESPGAYVGGNQIMIDRQVVCETSELKLIGKHNWENVCAAITTFWQISKDIELIRTVVTNFEGLEHRLEFVNEKNDIMFYNDSFASMPNASSAAINSIKGPKILIIGGFDRDLPLNELTTNISENKQDIAKIILIGQSGNRVAEELIKINYDNFIVSDAKSMSEVLKLALKHAKPGESIVLSPGFPSFDMFKNFEDRGLQFKDIVNSL
jgi:UDP-N-acetylmuramoylalanine--D-glutamate ligase